MEYLTLWHWHDGVEKVVAAQGFNHNDVLNRLLVYLNL